MASTIERDSLHARYMSYTYVAPSLCSLSLSLARARAIVSGGGYHIVFPDERGKATNETKAASQLIIYGHVATRLKMSDLLLSWRDATGPSMSWDRVSEPSSRVPAVSAPLSHLLVLLDSGIPLPKAAAKVGATAVAMGGPAHHRARRHR